MATSTLHRPVKTPKAARIDLGDIPRALLAILAGRSTWMSADQLHCELARTQQEATVPAIYKAIIKLRSYELIELASPRSELEVHAAMANAAAIAMRMRLNTTSTSSGRVTVSRFRITAKGELLDAALALDVKGGIPDPQRRELVRRIMRSVICPKPQPR